MGNVKRMARKLLGDKMYSGLIKQLNILNVRRFYRYDRRKYAKHAFGLRFKQDQVNLRAQITLHYHALEKGLTHSSFRPGFGQKALFGIFSALDAYVAKGYDLKDIRFQTGLSTLQSYINRHEQIGFPVDKVKDKLRSFLPHFDNEAAQGGAQELTKKQVLQDMGSEFAAFAAARHSVRDFGQTAVPREVLEQAFVVAQSTPSVCNRQAWFTLVIERGPVLNQVLALQGGLSGEGRNIDKLLVVTTDNRYFYSGKERNQGYVDGGLYAMNLVYALHAQGVATCMLNANLPLSHEKQIKQLLALNEATNIILFIAAGSYADSFKAPVSQRDDWTASTRWIP